MDGDVHGVRIIPPIIEFKDTEVDVLHKINITVKNVSKSSKEIRYWHPTIKVCTLITCLYTNDFEPQFIYQDQS